MKILVKSRSWIESKLELHPFYFHDKIVISIYSSGNVSPFPSYFMNVLRLHFDDVTEKDSDDKCIFFNEIHAESIHKFIENIKTDELYIHCDAGVSRSGAIGYVLNEYINKYLIDNKVDYEYFKIHNSYIMPNPLVVRLLKLELFGVPFSEDRSE